MNYDHDVLGVGNSSHPANQEETDVFQSEDLDECLQHAKEEFEFEPLEFAINLQYERLKIAKKLIDELQVATTGNSYIKNKIQRIKNYL